MRGRAFVALSFFCLAAGASADELRLKDGTKIVGTIVGFEENTFKVQTSYGFALVQKDKIAAIIPSDAKKDATAPTPQAADNSRKPSAPEKKKAPVSSATGVVAGTATAAKPPTVPPSKKEADSAAAPPAPNEPPAKPAGALIVREEVQGNLYINHTHGFRMYKPPSWHILEGAQKALPAAVVAMGTSDETTLLVIGRERSRGSLESHAASTEGQLRDIYENYRRLSEGRSRVAGLPALERRYRGTVDGHDWSGVVLSLARGNEVFTILGMTYADSDLIQIQENVIAKTIASLEFTPR